MDSPSLPSSSPEIDWRQELWLTVTKYRHCQLCCIIRSPTSREERHYLLTYNWKECHSRKWDCEDPLAWNTLMMTLLLSSWLTVLTMTITLDNITHTMLRPFILREQLQPQELHPLPLHQPLQEMTQKDSRFVYLILCLFLPLSFPRIVCISCNINNVTSIEVEQIIC